MFKEWLHRKMETNEFIRVLMSMCYDVPVLVVPLLITTVFVMFVLVHTLWVMATKHFVGVLVGLAVFYITWRIVKWFGGEYKNHYH